jgi:predicted phosphodiesterase
MRILLTSDLHYKLRQYDWLLGAGTGFDAVVIAGDDDRARGLNTSDF